MKLTFTMTTCLLEGLLVVWIIGGNSSSAQSLNQQDCSQEYLSSIDQNLPNAIALNKGEDLLATIEKVFECSVSLSNFQLFSDRLNFQNGEEFGAIRGMAFNVKTQEIGAFVAPFPEFSAAGKLVVVPSDLIEMWTSTSAKLLVSGEAFSKFSGTEDWKLYGEYELARYPLPDNLVQSLFLPPSISNILFNSVPSDANVFVGDTLYGDTNFEALLKINKLDAVRFEKLGFKDCDLSSGAVVNYMGDRPVSFECDLSDVTP